MNMMPFVIFLCIVAAIALAVWLARKRNAARIQRQVHNINQGYEYMERARKSFERGDTLAQGRYSRIAAQYFTEAEQWHLADLMTAQALGKEWHHLEAAQTLENALRRLPVRATQGDTDPYFLDVEEGSDSSSSPDLPETVLDSERARILCRQASFYRMGGWHSRAYELAGKALIAGAAEVVGTVALRQMAQLAAYARDWKVAELHAEKAATQSETAADRSEATQTLAFIRHSQGRLTEALSLNEGLIEQEGTGPKVYSQAAGLLQNLGRFDEAATRIQAAMSRVGESRPTLVTTSGALYCIQLAEIRFFQERYPESAELLNAARGAYPAHHIIGAYTAGASLLLDAASRSVPPDVIRSRARELVADFDKRMERIPSPVDALRYYFDSLLFVAQALIACGDADECFAILDRYSPVELLPVSQPRYYYLRGMCHEIKSDLPAAATAYTNATHTECDPAEWYVTLASRRLTALSDGTASAVQ